MTRARSCLPRRPRLQAALLLIIYTTFCDAFGSDALTEQSPISVAAVAAAIIMIQVSALAPRRARAAEPYS